MSEPDPKDLRRLRRLEAQLAKTTEEAKAAAAERRDLTRRLTAAEKAASRVEALEAASQEAREALKTERAEAKERIRAAEERAAAAIAAVGSLPEQVEALLRENRRLAEQLDAVRGDVTTLGKAAEEARQAAETARSEAVAATKAQTQAEETIRRLSEERASLATRLGAAEAQLQDEGKTVILPADEAARQVGTLVDQLSAGLPNLSVREGEFRLKVAFGGAGDLSGFVIPTADSSPELRNALHELTLRFDQTGPAI